MISSRPRGALLTTLLSAILTAASSLGASALPAGRTWTPYTTMAVPGADPEDFLHGYRLDCTERGIPYLVLAVRWDSAERHVWNTFAWADSGWRPALRSTVRAGGGPEYAVPSSIPADMAFKSYHDNATADFNVRLALMKVWPDSIGEPDSVYQTTMQSSEYAAATSARRRWAVRSENYNRDPVNHVRVFYSDTARIWHEVERLGVDEDHCTVAPLGDTTALVVYAGVSGLEYAVLDGTQWTESGNLDPRPFNPANPRLRPRPSGGWWLMWADDGWVHMSTYRDGIWSRGDSVRCLPAVGETFQPYQLEAEHTSGERPVLAWTNAGYGYTYRDMTAIAFPNGNGWDPGEEVPGSDQSGWIAPTMTTDLNGDVWLVWRRASEGINRWIHTYCSATCGAPAVSTHGVGTRVTWALSARAPNSRWTVFRAAGDSPFDSLATVRASEDSVLAFDDATALAGRTWRYRIRRESVDVRYRWESDVATHWRPDTGGPIDLALANPTGGQLTFRLTGAAGLLWARLYDLQGRVVLAERLGASGTGEDTFTLDLGASGARRPGIYFLRVTDAAGRASRVARVAVIR